MAGGVHDLRFELQIQCTLGTPMLLIMNGSVLVLSVLGYDILAWLWDGRTHTTWLAILMRLCALEECYSMPFCAFT